MYKMAKLLEDKLENQSDFGFCDDFSDKTPKKKK